MGIKQNNAFLLNSTNTNTLSMKLSQWARQKGIHYNTALKWHKQGKIPNSYELNGSIMIKEEVANTNNEYQEIIKLLREIKEKIK